MKIIRPRSNLLALLLDVSGTLAPDSIDVIISQTFPVAERMGAEFEGYEFTQELYRHEFYYGEKDVQLGNETEHAFARRFGEKMQLTGGSLDDYVALLTSAIKDSIKISDETLELLARIRRGSGACDGIPVVLFSNTYPSVAGMLKILKAEGIVNDAYLSCDEGYNKHQDESWEILLGKIIPAVLGRPQDTIISQDLESITYFDNSRRHTRNGRERGLDAHLVTYPDFTDNVLRRYLPKEHIRC